MSFTPDEMISSYNQVLETSIRIGGTTICIHHRPALQGGMPVRPGSQLLAEEILNVKGKKIIHFGCGNGGLSAYLGRTASEILLVDLDWSMLALADLTMSANNINNHRVIYQTFIPKEFTGQSDIVIVEIPKGRKIAQRWLLQACEALRNSGSLYLVGANREGIQSIARDAQDLFGKGTILGYKKGFRALMFRKDIVSHPTWAREDGIKTGTWLTFSTVQKGESYALHSLPGIFSYDRVDDGTQFLLDNFPDVAGKHVLDIGCGHGLIGLVASKTAASVDMVDTNIYAIAASTANLEAMHLLNVKSIFSDITSTIGNRGYDVILTNPPFHFGSEVSYIVSNSIIMQSMNVLNHNGQLWIVANKFIRYDQMMRKYFGNVTIVRSNNKFHILKAEKY